LSDGGKMLIQQSDLWVEDMCLVELPAHRKASNSKSVGNRFVGQTKCLEIALTRLEVEGILSFIKIKFDPFSFG
jgi:hypothetical protein